MLFVFVCVLVFVCDYYNIGKIRRISLEEAFSPYFLCEYKQEKVRTEMIELLRRGKTPHSK